MGISHSTARWIAPASFAIDFAAQQYGLLSTPSMKDVHDANLSFFSPQPYFIGGFFFPQQLFQLAWLYRLYKLDPSKGVKEKQEADTIVHFVPYYAVGNMCIATWMIFWNTSQLKIANIFVLINSFTQLYYISTLQPRMNLNSTSSVLTHIVSKTFAGIGILDFLHNGSVAYFNHNLYPSPLTKALTAVGFGSLALGSDWIFGGCIVYDLIGLSVGQSIYASKYHGDTSWSTLLGGYAAATALIVGIRNMVSRPYVREDVEGYEVVDDNDGDDNDGNE